MARNEEYVSRYSVCVNCNNEAVDCGKEKCPVYKAPTAKVVPSERLENAMKLLDKTEDELYEARGEIEKLTTELAAMRGAANSLKMHYENATADVVPKSEVVELSGKYEDLKLKYADLQRDHDELLAWGGHTKSTERAEIEKAVARVIFEEIDKFAYRYLNDADYSGGDMIYDIAELKKKYGELK